MKSVLFVCTANICRSPMAEGLFKSFVSDEIDDWEIGSAGTWADTGSPAASYTLAVLANRGIDLSEHASRRVTRELLSAYNLILVMERGHKEGIKAEFPEYSGKVFLISEMVGAKFEVRDPIGGPLVEYEYTSKEIENIFTRGFQRITELAEGK
jgi:protein-tyrosine-phosphatase